MSAVGKAAGHGLSKEKQADNSKLLPAGWKTEFYFGRL
jgi:hypothetical protein